MDQLLTPASVGQTSLSLSLLSADCVSIPIPVLDPPNNGTKLNGRNKLLICVKFCSHFERLCKSIFIIVNK